MPAHDDGPYTGSCLCGAVRYQVSGISPRMAHCHCSMCRKFHGAAFSTFGEARKADFRWMSGEDALATYEAPNGSIRRFCRHCGSSMTFDPGLTDFPFVEFALGTLDSDIPPKPDAHVYVAFTANWCVLHDELPKYAEHRGSRMLDPSQP